MPKRSLTENAHNSRLIPPRNESNKHSTSSKKCTMDFDHNHIQGFHKNGDKNKTENSACSNSQSNIYSAICEPGAKQTIDKAALSRSNGTTIEKSGNALSSDTKASREREAVNYRERTRNRHKAMLFSMFHGKCEEDKNSVGHSGSTKSFQNLLNSKSSELNQLQNKKRVTELALPTNATQALSAFRQHLNCRKDPEGAALKRGKFEAMHLRELEDRVMERFRISFLTNTTTSQINDDANEKENAAERNSTIIENEVVPRMKPDNFKPFSLLYNECSVAGICEWAGQDIEPDTKQMEDRDINQHDSSYIQKKKRVYIPTVATTFRKCSICNLWGHHEIECNKMNSDQVVSTARELKSQLTIRGLVEKNNSTPADTVEAKMGKNLQNRKCEVCSTSFVPEAMIPCSGCDRYWHFGCIDLEHPPMDDWFCEECENYNSDVSSTTEIEECEGFIIEQKKRPRIDKKKSKRKKTLCNDGNEDQQVKRKSGDNEVNFKGSNQKSSNETDKSVEETRLDDFFIKAKRCDDDISVEEIVVGSVVAFFPQIPYRTNLSANNETEQTCCLGVVLVLNMQNQKCLVQELSFAQKDPISNVAGAVADDNVHWISMDELHAVDDFALTKEEFVILNDTHARLSLNAHES